MRNNDLYHMESPKHWFLTGKTVVVSFLLEGHKLLFKECSRVNNVHGDKAVF